MRPLFVYALGDFLVLFVPVLRQIARYLPHHRTKNDSKTHPKSTHDKFKTASYSPLFRKSTSFWTARARWLMWFFTSPSSANVRS